MGKEPAHLPYTEGPYVPGCFDLMTEYSPDGSFIRMFYPTSLSDIKSHSSKWISWLPDLSYVDAFAYVLNTWAFLFRPMYKLFAGEVKVPVVWDADLREDGGKFPVIILSHGLGATRFFYSCICLELASRGFVVAAVEHRDHSSCSTFYYASAKDRHLDKRTPISFDKVPVGWNHLSRRQKQVRHRASECQRAVNLLEALDAGDEIENLMNCQFKLSQFKGRLDFSKLVMMGHSFGGGTAVRTMGNDSRFKAGIILDAWVFPIKEDADLPSEITAPMMFINTQTFQIPPNVAVMQRFMEGGNADKTERSAFTIRGTTHEHQSDSPFVIGTWLNLFNLKKLDSALAMKINNYLIFRFLRTHVGSVPGLPSEEETSEFLNQQDSNIAPVLSI
ncbi:hypothetical protein R5R35_004815 [Gryllus longicercus]|uniref:1-alkyl-2-acetylglycerophosphocholine esterase n=1 Tax=Gryllus longicercus TaxID=2509291 RepID=A0AAN9VY24_9ORTH